ncbi:MAG: tetratricopeptide repeat protein [Nitrosopumilaceae archaeon]|nr:tetratricopeptide repeat protein [Nitrosopumilaceae archaeon]NIU02456.1 tetratricopeptide repeat protein [Nitrosopumilaceae archaeon]NIU88917.1 tetratricopeptide repeat protein [Nitrosopumilaceae archaeon]NIV67028.1 tetratricopeptide repeat protein [Nitrosopumilaceae archaeon]NIX63057.1 tetratricopeptide repeat protein [Nitrosopumilaceae archaeon]
MDKVAELVERGKSMLEEGSYFEALTQFENAIKENDKDPDLWNLKGVALRSMGRYEEARECFNKSLQLDPRDKMAS